MGISVSNQTKAQSNNKGLPYVRNNDMNNDKLKNELSSQRYNSPNVIIWIIYTVMSIILISGVIFRYRRVWRVKSVIVLVCTVFLIFAFFQFYYVTHV